MNHFEDNEEQQIAEALKTNLQYTKFVEQMLALDKARYNSIYDDSQSRAEFFKKTPEEQLLMFSPDFQKEIQDLWTSFNGHKQAQHSLALGVYRLGQLTGTTYKDIAERLEAAFQKQLSRSYISKLYRVGKLLTNIPELASVSDTEKIAELSRIPENKLKTMVETTPDGIVRVANSNVLTASRAQIQSIVRKEVPINRPALKSVSQVVAHQSAPSWNYKILNDTLQQSLPQIDPSEAELIAAIQNCLRIINERNQ